MEENKKVCRAHVEFTEDEFMALASLCAEWNMTIQEVICKLITDKAVEIVNAMDIPEEKEETLEYHVDAVDMDEWEYTEEEKEKAAKQWKKLQEYLYPMLNGEIVWDAGLVMALMYSLADEDPDLDEEFGVGDTEPKEIPLS